MAPRALIAIWGIPGAGKIHPGRRQGEPSLTKSKATSLSSVWPTTKKIASANSDDFGKAIAEYFGSMEEKPGKNDDREK